MSTVFPLHSVILKEIQSEPLTLENKKTFLGNLKKLQKEAKENLYLLIRYHDQLHSEEKIIEKARFGNKTVSFKFGDFPEELQKICHRFVEKHLEETSDSFVEIEFDSQQEQKLLK